MVRFACSARGADIEFASTDMLSEVTRRRQTMPVLQCSAAGIEKKSTSDLLVHGVAFIELVSWHYITVYLRCKKKVFIT